MTEQLNPSFFSCVLDDMREGILVIGPNGVLKYCNENARKMLGLEENQSGSILNWFQSNPKNDAFTDCILDSIYTRALHLQETVQYTTSDGSVLYFQLTTSYLNSEADRKGDIIVTLSDITELVIAYRRGRDHVIILTTLMAVLCVWNLIYSIWNTMGQPISDRLLTKGVEVIGIVMFFFILKTTSLRLKDMGIGLDHIGPVMKRSVLISLCVAAGMIITKVGIMLVSPGFFPEGTPFFNPQRVGFVFLQYIYTAMIQEFISRGIIQSSLTLIYDGKHKDILAIGITSLFFAALHIHKGLPMCIGAGIMSILLGCLYRKDRNIWGISLIHYTVGIIPNLLGIIS